MKNLNGKVAVVTGAGSGIGRALARALATAGCHLALCDIDADSLGETQSLVDDNVRCEVWTVDVSDRDAMHSFTLNYWREMDARDSMTRATTPSCWSSLSRYRCLIEIKGAFGKPSIVCKRPARKDVPRSFAFVP